tara:strand:- start:8073 stop:8681 length:609 start_codon:yes stop_codon:yes gene_type:complete
MTKMNKIYAVILTLVILLLTSCSQESKDRATQIDSQETKSDKTYLSSTLKEFDLVDLNGVIVNSSKWNNQFKLINFWATWCAPCRREIPLLNKTQNQYNEMSVQIIGIAVDVLEDVISYSQETAFNYPVLVGEEEAVAIAEDSNVEFIGLPFTMLVDNNNEIIKTHIGEIKQHHIDLITEVIIGMQEGKLSILDAKNILGKI